ncbi:RDD family protein [Nocardioides sp. R-C-SC26]|uniref:RDD family protein n=1 Tax=Nocardioides sp. R-C-SC26 TaxID=2870414 RepID=UPI001E5BE508|nr:RDD family protein [Nocardioides sp. R-C-SC26]
MPTPDTALAAELDRRFYAFALDRAVAWGLMAGAGYASWRFYLDDGRVGAGIGVIVGAVAVVSLAFAVPLGVAGVSPGKAALGLRVVRSVDGRPIGIAAALVRTALLGIFTLPTLGLGLATLAWTAVMDPGGKRRGIHDRMTDAVVVDVRPRPEPEAPDADGLRQVVNLTAMRLRPAPADRAAVSASTGPAASSSTRADGASGVLRAAAAPAAPPSVPPDAAPSRGPRPTSPPGGRPASPPAGSLGPRPSSPPPIAGAPATRRGQWRVDFDTGEGFLVEGLALVGRRPEARAGEPVRHLVPLPSSDMSVSKTHAQFQVVPDGALVVMDRGSTNGSVVVRGEVTKSLTAGRPTTLIDGDVVRFGDRSMRVTRVDRAADVPQSDA